MSSPHAFRPRRLLAFAAALVAATIVLTGCVGANPNEASPNDPGAKPDLNIAMGIGPGTLDPALINQAAQWYIDLAYSPLIQSSSDGTLRPGLATEWGYIGTDNTEFQLTLREGVKFSDGSELTADGVKQHLEYVQGANGQMAPILATMTSVATEGNVVTIKFSAPNPELPYYFAQSGVGIANVISPDGLKDPEALGTATHGAGQYMLDESATVSDDHYVYVPNPNYWDLDNVQWNRVTIKVIPNINSMLNALKSGQADFMQGDASTAAEAESAGLQVHFVPNVFNGLNLLDRAGVVSKPLGDQRVRQAINFAIDRDAIVNAIYGKYGTATTQTTHDLGFQESLDDYYAFNPTKAKELLADAGYPDGFTFKVLSTPVFGADTLVEAISGQLANVGITVETESVSDPNEWVGKMMSGEYPAAWIGYGSQPMFVQGPGLYLPGAMFNPFNSEDDQITADYEELAVAMGDDVKVLAESIETRLVELAWYAPVGWAPLGHYASDKIDSETVLATNGKSPIAAVIELKPAK